MSCTLHSVPAHLFPLTLFLLCRTLQLSHYCFYRSFLPRIVGDSEIYVAPKALSMVFQPANSLPRSQGIVPIMSLSSFLRVLRRHGGSFCGEYPALTRRCPLPNVLYPCVCKRSWYVGGWIC